SDFLVCETLVHVLKRHCSQVNDAARVVVPVARTLPSLVRRSHHIATPNKGISPILWGFSATVSHRRTSLGDVMRVSHPAARHRVAQISAACMPGASASAKIVSASIPASTGKRAMAPALVAAHTGT